jgi:5-methylcytosine-specific restriction endonuclease McrA
MYNDTTAFAGRNTALHQTYLRLYLLQDGHCFYCQQPMLLPSPPHHKCPLPPQRITLEHLVPRAHGGTHHPDNIVGACCRCNHERGSDIPWTDFLALKLQQAWAVQ